MRYIAPLTNFGGVRCGLFVGLARLNDLLQMTVSFNALSASIPYPYLLAITAYSFSVSSMIVGIRVVVGLKKLGLRFKVRVQR